MTKERTLNLWMKKVENQFKIQNELLADFKAELDNFKEETVKNIKDAKWEGHTALERVNHNLGISGDVKTEFEQRMELLLKLFNDYEEMKTALKNWLRPADEIAQLKDRVKDCLSEMSDVIGQD